jgi:hypothetical protein
MKTISAPLCLRRLLFVVAVAAACLGLAACDPEVPLTRSGLVQTNAKHKTPLLIDHKAPVFRTKARKDQVVVYDPATDYWVWMIVTNNQYVMTESTATPPPYDPVPIGGVPTVDLPTGSTGMAGNVTVAPIEVDPVSSTEISTWEGEGGNLGPSEMGASAAESDSSESSSDSGSDSGGDGSD